MTTSTLPSPSAAPLRPRIRKRKGLSKGRRKLARREAHRQAFERASERNFWNAVSAPEGCSCQRPPRWASDICPYCAGCAGVKAGCAGACACFGSGDAAQEILEEMRSDRRYGFWLANMSDGAAGRCLICGSGSTRTMPFIGGYQGSRAYVAAGRRERLCFDVQACKRRRDGDSTSAKILAAVESKRLHRRKRGLPPNDRFNLADWWSRTGEQSRNDRLLERCRANPQTRQSQMRISGGAIFYCAACPLSPRNCPQATADWQPPLATAPAGEPVSEGELALWRNLYARLRA